MSLCTKLFGLQQQHAKIRSLRMWFWSNGVISNWVGYVYTLLSPVYPVEGRQQWRTVACFPPGSVWMAWFTTLTCNYRTGCHEWASFPGLEKKASGAHSFRVCARSFCTCILVSGTLDGFEVRTNILLMMASLHFFEQLCIVSVR